MLGYASSSEVGGVLCEIGEQFKDKLNQFSVGAPAVALFSRVHGTPNPSDEHSVRNPRQPAAPHREPGVWTVFRTKSATGRGNHALGA